MEVVWRCYGAGGKFPAAFGLSETDIWSFTRLLSSWFGNEGTGYGTSAGLRQAALEWQQCSSAACRIVVRASSGLRSHRNEPDGWPMCRSGFGPSSLAGSDGHRRLIWNT